MIGNLEKSDFHLFEDGKEQEIKYFTRETDLPLTIGLLVDVSGSQERLIDTERRAASQFFRSVLRPKDLAFLISFGKDSELLQDSTSSPKLLEDGLKDLKLNAGSAGWARVRSRPSRTRPARSCGMRCTWPRMSGSRTKRAVKSSW